MLALVRDTTAYRLMGLLHIVSVVVAFGPLFLYPSLRRAGATDVVAKMHVRLVLPALVVVWALGMGMVGMSEDAFELTQTWLSLSIAIWVVLMVTSWFLIRPALTDRGESAKSKLAAGVGVNHLLLVVTLYLMLFKPGLG